MQRRAKARWGARGAKLVKGEEEERGERGGGGRQRQRAVVAPRGGVGLHAFGGRGVDGMAGFFQSLFLFSPSHFIFRFFITPEFGSNWGGSFQTLRQFFDDRSAHFLQVSCLSASPPRQPS